MSTTGFSIAPPGAIGGVPSPVKSGRPNTNGRKGPTAAQLLDQIKHLEAEGNKLRTETSAGFGGQTFTALSNLNTVAGSSEKSELPKFTSTSPSALSALVDISAEQKTISDLRMQLEQQKKETEKLSSHLTGEGFTSSSSRTGTVFHLPNSPSKTGFSTLPSTELFGTRKALSTTSMDMGPPSHLEKALKDSQEQVADLRRRLMEASDLSESQKRQFRLTIEELKAKLHDTLSNRDTLVDLKQKEVIAMENKIDQYEVSMKELQSKIKAQEQALNETNRKAEGISRENYVSETTLNQVRLILVEAERRRGKSFFETDPASQQNSSMLVHTLERCIQEMLKDLDVNKSRVKELEADLATLKQSQNSDQQNMSIEYQQKITQMTSDHEHQMHKMNEKLNSAKKEVASLQTQLSTIQSQHDNQLKIKEDSVRDMEAKIKHLREELNEERDKYNSKRENLEHTLSGTEKEMSKLRNERDEALKNHSNMEKRVADLQLTINKLTRDIEAEKESSGKFWEREAQLRSKQMTLEARLEEKTKDVDRLEKLLASVKQECTATVTEKVTMIEKQERERHMEKISSLTAQLSETSEKCNKVSLDLDNNKAENRDLRQQIRELSDRTDTTKVQYDAVVAERKHLSDMLTAKTSDFERVSQERDYYFNIMEQKNNELSQLKTAKERLSVQIEEKEKNIAMLHEQVTNLQQVLETNSRNSESMREERDLYAKQLHDTTTALEELKSSRDVMSKKMKIRERRIKELETEKQKNSDELDLRNQELEIIQQEKETLFKELKESRYEVANLTEEKDALKKEWESEKYHLEKSIGKLQYRLKSSEQDLTLTQKALRKRESVDNTAVKMADKMQKEVTAKRSLVDTLQSKIRWYQDQIDSLLKEKSNLEEDKDKLKSSLNKALVQNQHLAVELEAANSRSSDLKTHSHKLEASLEKATLRNATTQAQVEMFEQELTRMKLAHQLEMQEAVQRANNMKIESKPTAETHKVSQPEVVSQSVKQPEDMAQEDRKVAQKSSESYKEMGSELKYLLNEMRALITEKQDSNRDKVPKRSRPRPERPIKRHPPAPQFVSPLDNQKKAFTHYRVPLTTSSDMSYYSDGEADERTCHNRSRSLTGNYALYSPEKSDSRRKKLPKSKHRRSRSAEASFMMPQDSTTFSDSDYRMSDGSHPVLDTESCITGSNSDNMISVQTGDEISFESRDLMQSGGISFGPPIMESTKEDLSPSPVRIAVPDTHELCKRLEERIASLTKMGDNLQKENKEMADLMKTQGKKLKKVKEVEKKIRKTTR